MNQRIILFRLFFSYFILSVLICVFSYITNYFFIANSKNSVDQKIYSYGKQVQTKIEECFINYKNLSAQINQNTIFAPDVFLSGLGGKHEGIQKLREIASYNSSIPLLAVYYGGDDFYTTSGFVSPGVFFENMSRVRR